MGTGQVGGNWVTVAAAPSAATTALRRRRRRRCLHTLVVTASPCLPCCRRAQYATGLHDLQQWAEAEKCGEAQCLLAKALLRVAMNRVLRFVPLSCGLVARAS